MQLFLDFMSLDCLDFVLNTASPNLTTNQVPSELRGGSRSTHTTVP